MKKHPSLFKSILADTLFFALIFGGLHVVLALFKLQFRQWVYDVSVALIISSLFAGLIQLLLKIKRSSLKALLIVLCTAGYILLTVVLAGIAMWTYEPEFVTERDGNQYLVREFSFLKTSLCYYDYKNAFVSGNVLRISELYDAGSYDDGCPTLRVSYYDENGSLISEEDAAQ